MKSPKKNKHHFINEIINIIKKYNISIEDIIKAYITKYNVQFTSEEKIIHNLQYQRFIKYATDDSIIKYATDDSIINKSSNNGYFLSNYKIIDDYVLI
jgi:hypothetical protein